MPFAQLQWQASLAIRDNKHTDNSSNYHFHVDTLVLSPSHCDVNSRWSTKINELDHRSNTNKRKRSFFDWCILLHFVSWANEIIIIMRVHSIPSPLCDTNKTDNSFREATQAVPGNRRSPGIETPSDYCYESFISRFCSTHVDSIRFPPDFNHFCVQVSGTHFNFVLMAVGICTWPFQLRLRGSWSDRSNSIRELCMGQLKRRPGPAVDFLASQYSHSVRPRRCRLSHFWHRHIVALGQRPLSSGVLMCLHWTHGKHSI